MDACERAADRSTGALDRRDIKRDRFGAFFDRVALIPA
jgi:hypothetical protein